MRTTNYINNHIANAFHTLDMRVTANEADQIAGTITLADGHSFSYDFNPQQQDGTANLDHNIGGNSVSEYAASGTHAATILAAALRNHYA